MKRPPALRPPDATAGEYEGPRLWQVLLKDRVASVAAPTPEAAMVAAASFWGLRWQAADFYEAVKIIPI